ncbi:SPOR domain-containing protein [Magnetococcus sp. PR-3]|uniref:SPOR domain-containing protein n=1 Tax=Magnetococcus sp. PR-3 TaxID=3120355 RepID=UPI002FCE2B55
MLNPCKKWLFSLLMVVSTMGLALHALANPMMEAFDAIPDSSHIGQIYQLNKLSPNDRLLCTMQEQNLQQDELALQQLKVSLSRLETLKNRLELKLLTHQQGKKPFAQDLFDLLTHAKMLAEENLEQRALHHKTKSQTFLKHVTKYEKKCVGKTIVQASDTPTPQDLLTQPVATLTAPSPSEPVLPLDRPPTVANPLDQAVFYTYLGSYTELLQAQQIAEKVIHMTGTPTSTVTITPVFNGQMQRVYVGPFNKQQASTMKQRIEKQLHLNDLQVTDQI